MLGCTHPVAAVHLVDMVHVMEPIGSKVIHDEVTHLWGVGDGDGDDGGDGDGDG